MPTQKDFMTDVKPTWCPGCGNFAMWTALTQALSELGLEPFEVAMVFDIGCNGNGANWHRLYGFHSLHGRTLPVATAIKLANHGLTVLASSGDGGGYGEGGNHFLHACRRNTDVTYIVHKNERYSLTTGQTSPTTKVGQKTKTALRGSQEYPLNGLQIALTAGATFVARGFADEVSHLKSLYKQAIKHPGFAVVEVLQPCVVFYDQQNIRDTYHSKIYKLEQGWPAADRLTAYKKAGETERLPIGVFFKEDRPTFESQQPAIQKVPLARQTIGKINLQPFLKEFR